jgi:Ca2+-binding RTX toxin-like protein
VFAACAAMTATAAGPEVTEEAFPDYTAAHTVIKCPYLPPGLSEVPLCHGKKATCVGTDGHDLILGSDKHDVIVAGPGNDVVHGDAADDILCGGPGNDSLFGARGADIIYGGPGDDWLFGAPDPDELYGGPGDFDVLWDGPGYGKLDGGPGNYDVCMLQREMAEVIEGTCETIYPPPGYLHDDEPEPGVLKKSDPLKLKK